MICTGGLKYFGKVILSTLRVMICTSKEPNASVNLCPLSHRKIKEKTFQFLTQLSSLFPFSHLVHFTSILCRGRRYGLFKKMNIFFEWIFWILKNDFFEWIFLIFQKWIFVLNKYSRFLKKNESLFWMNILGSRIMNNPFEYILWF